MPRKTHPATRAKHARVHIRDQAHRWANKRFNRAKRMFGDYDRLTALKDDNGQIIEDPYGLGAFAHPNDIRNDPRRYASFFFGRHNSQWSKNWQTYCSCLGCSKHRMDPVPRAVHVRAWMEDWAEEMLGD